MEDDFLATDNHGQITSIIPHPEQIFNSLIKSIEDDDNQGEEI